MLAAFGYLFLCIANLIFTIVCAFGLFLGGSDLGHAFSYGTPWSTRFVVVAISLLNILFWYLLYVNAPFTVTVGV